MTSSYKIAIVGEAYGAEEALYGKPFIGAAGEELNRILADAGLRREDIFLTNVFNLQPQNNDLAYITVPRTHPDAVVELGALSAGRYLQRRYAGEVARLVSELERVRPNVAVLVGNTACWAILGLSAISKIRGAVAYSSVIPGLKCLPTYHPAAVLRQYDLRHVTVFDFIKAKSESAFPEIRRPKREIWLEPTLADISDFRRRYIDGCECLCFDIETADGEITCIGFAPTVDRALVIPFVDQRKPKSNYWPNHSDELSAWTMVADILAGPEPKVGQNGLYDIQYLWMKMGIPVNNYQDDTMLLHHSLFPESPKGLAFLGSVYTNEGAWKTERPRGKHTIKRED